MANIRAAQVQFAARTDFLRLAAECWFTCACSAPGSMPSCPQSGSGAEPCPWPPELFSIMADARLALGQISLERYFCDTDYGGKSSVPRFL